MQEHLGEGLKQITCARISSQLSPRKSNCKEDEGRKEVVGQGEYDVKQVIFKRNYGQSSQDLARDRSCISSI